MSTHDRTAIDKAAIRRDMIIDRLHRLRADRDEFASDEADRKAAAAKMERDSRKLPKNSTDAARLLSAAAIERRYAEASAYQASVLADMIAAIEAL